MTAIDFERIKTSISNLEEAMKDLAQSVERLEASKEDVLFHLRLLHHRLSDLQSIVKEAHHE